MKRFFDGYLCALEILRRSEFLIGDNGVLDLFGDWNKLVFVEDLKIKQIFHLYWYLQKIRTGVICFTMTSPDGYASRYSTRQKWYGSH